MRNPFQVHQNCSFEKGFEANKYLIFGTVLVDKGASVDEFDPS